MTNKTRVRELLSGKWSQEAEREVKSLTSMPTAFSVTAACGEDPEGWFGFLSNEKQMEPGSFVGHTRVGERSREEKAERLINRCLTIHVGFGGDNLESLLGEAGLSWFVTEKEDEIKEKARDLVEEGTKRGLQSEVGGMICIMAASGADENVLRILGKSYATEMGEVVAGKLLMDMYNSSDVMNWFDAKWGALAAVTEGLCSGGASTSIRNSGGKTCLRILVEASKRVTGPSGIRLTSEDRKAMEEILATLTTAEKSSPEDLLIKEKVENVLSGSAYDAMILAWLEAEELKAEGAPGVEKRKKKL